MKLPVVFQRLEGLVVALSVSIFYFISGGNILLFIITILAIDVFMVGYLLDKKIGALVYNLGHSYILSVLLLLFSYIDQSGVMADISLVWIIHIAIDRAFGFGLKHTTGFSDTHLGKIGRK